ncbi:PREDICTED: C-Jun-amino-terminal kinase-interacting protein 3-like isoform X2 [Amphimedon queenslandica]|uniref:RH1 domain-containing protein n=1 Tax=Amphimedon queenslandica TaxID=400682 RepID=A0AAN0J0S8_AMPQE|nr:PREDICTED: C-Jun-amino-terminal kinase-interacting protein 3-like isoform X2 [Amphimedon queenslandica]|eukprot:XP_019850321.1 PREDICTED: C-Jun-amino-terminal kinase-interacting protein 3-like isoform X2 [Amphimedon queenslandica]
MAVVLEDDPAPPVSERVQFLAKSIYDELESLIGEHGPDSIGNLMPLVVNILENLDSALSDNQDHLNAVMELTEENQQLVSNYEKEKQYRKEIEEKAILMEDANDNEIRTLKDQNATLVLENKSLHNKLSSQTEQTEKLDERHEQLKLEYKDLHEKNLELIRNLHGRKDFNKDGGLSTAVRNREESITSYDTPVVPGFQDFTVSKQKKKRQQPSIPVKVEGLLSPTDENFIGNTPAVHRIDSPELEQGSEPLPSTITDLEQEIKEKEEDETEDIMDQQGFLVNPDDDVPVNEQSLFAEMGDSNAFEFSGLDDILLENKQLHNEKEDLSKQLEALNKKVIDLEMNKNELIIAKEDFSERLALANDEVKKLKKEIHDNKEELRQMSDNIKVGQPTGSEGLRISRLEIAKVLRERNEWKEKYFSLLEQVRMNDELYLFKRKDKKSRWVDYFTALFSSTRRRQLEQSLIESSPHRPILAAGTVSTNEGGDILTQEDLPVYDGAGYAKTKVIPTLKRVGKKEDEVYLTSVSWVIPNMPDMSPSGSPVPPLIHASPNINTCRPMSFQDEGAKILCATAVNNASFLKDCSNALSVPKNTEFSTSEDSSMSLVWICTGTSDLTKVSVLDTAAVGEVLETFAVCSTPIVCMSAIPSFDDKDPDVLSSLSTKVKKSTGQTGSKERPSSQYATIWMGSESGVLYVHSALSQWKKCLHADRLPAGIQGIVHSKGKVFLLLQNATLAVFMRYSDGEWDWDNYELVPIAQKKNLPVTALATVKYNVWCAIGNTIHVLHSHSLRNEANFTVHSWKNAEVQQLLSVGEGVWVVFKRDSVLRLFNATSFTHMQDLDIAPSVHKIIVFGSEKMSNVMPVPVSCVVAAQNSLWIGTENGIILNFPFSRPTIVAEESGWEVIKVVWCSLLRMCNVTVVVAHVVGV